MTRRLRTAVLISGRGSNMMSLVDAAKSSDYPAEIVLVISNRPKAAGLDKAEASGIKAFAIDHKAFKDREAFEDELHAALKAHEIEFIACAGFMRVLTEGFVSKWNRRMINIHPSLLPKYKGLNTHRRALEAGDTEAGATVHWVVPEVDGGDIIDQISVPIRADETEESLQSRILEKELLLYPRALKKAAQAVLSA